MMVNLEKRMEKIFDLLSRLSEEGAKGIPIIIEGKKDVRSLKRLKIKGNMITAKTFGMTSIDVLREIKRRQKREVIILLDFDRRGKELTKRLLRQFEREKIKCNLSYWKKLQFLVGRNVKDVEGLYSYLETLMDKLGNTNRQSN